MPSALRWGVGCKRSELGWVKKTGYTGGMDSVRFGKVLGIGTRLAAKTMVAAVDAATAPNPSTGKAASGTARSAPQAETRAAAAGTRLGQKAAETKAQVQQKQKNLKQGKKRFGEAVWGPFTKAGKVLWLEFTGVFFGLFSLSAATGAWKLRSAMHGTDANHEAHVQFLIAVAVSIVFGYFCVTGFVRASRRGRK
ncbi:MAG: hypothetical protein JWM43_1727 [Acidobacteriaceae bacterium]|nr:hypothetical protein [Acidobacteriaceae bacterium]